MIKMSSAETHKNDWCYHIWSTMSSVLAGPTLVMFFKRVFCLSFNPLITRHTLTLLRPPLYPHLYPVLFELFQVLFSTLHHLQTSKLLIISHLYKFCVCACVATVILYTYKLTSCISETNFTVL